MSLTGLLPAVADDPQLRRALSYAGQPGSGDADLVAPPALRPVLVAALAALSETGNVVGGPGDRDRGRFVLAITATAREAEDLTSALTSLLPDPHAAEYFPAWETLPHERLSPRSDTSGRRLAVLRRLVSPDRGDPRSGPLQVVATPVRSVLQPLVGGLGQLEPGPAGPGQAGRARGRGDQAGRDRVRPGRPGHQPGRDRGPRRHPRRVPAHRGAPAPGRVLRLGDRGDQAVPRGRPAVARHLGRLGLGAAVPRAAADPRRAAPRQAAGLGVPGPRRRARARWPTASPSRAWRRSRRCWPTGWNCCSTRCRPARWWSPATRSGSGPAPPTWCAPARNSSRPPG